MKSKLKKSLKRLFQDGGSLHFRLFQDDRLRRLVLAHVREMLHTRVQVVGDCGEVNVRDLFLVTELLHDGRDRRVVNVADSGEQVVLDLVVEAAVQSAEPGVTNVRGRDDLKQFEVFIRGFLSLVRFCCYLILRSAPEK